MDDQPILISLFFPVAFVFLTDSSWHCLGVPGNILDFRTIALTVIVGVAMQHVLVV